MLAVKCTDLFTQREATNLPCISSKEKACAKCDEQYNDIETEIDLEISSWTT